MVKNGPYYLHVVKFYFKLNKKKKKYKTIILTKKCINRDVTGKFPDFPDEDEGGSTLIFKNKSVAELEDELADMVKYILLENCISKIRNIPLMQIH